MYFLDTDDHYLMADTRAGMVAALLEHLDGDPDDTTLATLAAACLGSREEDVIIS